MSELSEARKKRHINPEVKAGRLRMKSFYRNGIGVPYYRIELDIYDKKIEGYDPYIREFYAYNPQVIEVLDGIEEKEWIRVMARTESKFNERINQRYTVSTCLSVGKINKSEVESINNKE